MTLLGGPLDGLEIDRDDGLSEIAIPFVDQGGNFLRATYRRTGLLPGFMTWVAEDGVEAPKVSAER